MKNAEQWTEMYQKGYDNATKSFAYIPDFKNEVEKAEYTRGLRDGYNANKKVKKYIIINDIDGYRVKLGTKLIGDELSGVECREICKGLESQDYLFGEYICYGDAGCSNTDTKPSFLK